MTNRSDLNRSLFVFARDKNTNNVSRIAIPFDAQIGTIDNPSELQLHGRLALKTSTYVVNDAKPVRISTHDTISGIKLNYVPTGSYVDVFLPTAPQDGELHYVVDTGNTANSYALRISSPVFHTISGETYQYVSTAAGSLAVYWNSINKEWSLLNVNAGGGGGGGGGDPDATYVVISTTSSLSNERVLSVGNGLAISDAGAGGNVTLSNTRPGDLGASYVVISTTASLPNERALAVSGGIHLIDNGAGNSVTLVNTMPGDTFPQYLLLTNTASLPNERAIAQGVGIKFLDGGVHSDFTIFIDNEVVATITGSRFTGPVITAGGLTGSLQRLTTGQTYIASTGGLIITTSSIGQVNIALNYGVVGDPGASYLVIGNTGSLSNERAFAVGTDLSMSDGGANGTLTIYNNHGFDRQIPVPVMYLTGSLTQQRVLSAGSGITITDYGAGNAVSIALEQFTSQSTHAFHGYCTGSLNFASTDWSDVSNVFLGSFVETVTSHISRSASTFTVVRDGIYSFKSDFAANLASGSHIAFRLTGSGTTLLQHTNWQPAGDGQPNAALEGLVSLTSGSTVVLQYATSGSAFEWPSPGLVGGPAPDVEKARTGQISLFLIADPVVVTQSFTTNNNTVTGSGWITACDVNFAASSSVTVVDGGGNTVGGLTWFAKNIAASATSVANVPGDGFVIDPNGNNTDNGLTTNNAPQVGLRLNSLISDWNLDDVELRIWVQFNVSGALDQLNAAQVELARTDWANDNRNYSFRSRKYSISGVSFRSVQGLIDNTTAFTQTHDQDHNIIVMHWRNPRHCDFFSSYYYGGNLEVNDTVWPNISSTYYRGQGDLKGAGISPVYLTGSGDLSFIWSAFPQNSANNFTASMQRLKVEYRRGVGTGGGGSGGGGGGGGGTGGGDPDAPYLVAATTGSLTAQRLVVAGPGITINDKGANSLFEISASSFAPDADLYAKYIVLETTTSLPNERALTVGAGLTMSDGGPGGNVTITNTRPGDLAPSYIILSSTASLPNERTLTAGTNVSFTDNGPGNSLIINALTGTASGDPNAAYVVLALTTSLSNERRLIAGTGISLVDGGAGGNLTISADAANNFADISASYIVVGVTSSLPYERQLAAGSGISITDNGANSTIVITNTKQGADAGASFIVMGLTASLNNERVLTPGAGIAITDNGANNTVVISTEIFPADVSASYLVLANTGTLVNERAITAGYGIVFNDGGANSTFTISVNTGSVAPPSASYVVMALTGALPNERVLTAGSGIAITDNGANNTVVISTDGTGYGDRAASYVVLNATSSLDNERVLTAGSGITLTDNGPGSSIVISSTGGGGGSRFPDPEAFFIYSGIKNSLQTTWEAVGAFEFTPDGVNTMAPSGSTAYQAFFQPILEVYPSGTLVAARLYNITTPGEVTNSVVTGSSVSPQALKSTNLSGSLLSGQNLYEMQIKVSSSSGSPAYVTLKGAKLGVIWL